MAAAFNDAGAFGSPSPGPIGIPDSASALAPYAAVGPVLVAMCSSLLTPAVGWTGPKLRWSLSMDETERTELVALAAPCENSVVEYESAP